jgi:prepilin-type processing-associated H-X9-DG protein
MCPAGKITRILKASEVFLFGDGKGNGTFEYPGFVVQARNSTDDTLYDYWNSQEGYDGSGQFDHKRHRNRMNVAFVDGHAETVQMPPVNRLPRDAHGDFDRIGVSRGIDFR